MSAILILCCRRLYVTRPRYTYWAIITVLNCSAAKMISTMGLNLYRYAVGSIVDQIYSGYGVRRLCVCVSHAKCIVIDMVQSNRAKQRAKKKKTNGLKNEPQRSIFIQLSTSTRPMILVVHWFRLVRNVAIRRGKHTRQTNWGYVAYVMWHISLSHLPTTTKLSGWSAEELLACSVLASDSCEVKCASHAIDFIRIRNVPTNILCSATCSLIDLSSIDFVRSFFIFSLAFGRV